MQTKGRRQPCYFKNKVHKTPSLNLILYAMFSRFSITVKRILLEESFGWLSINVAVQCIQFRHQIHDFVSRMVHTMQEPMYNTNIYINTLCVQRFSNKWSNYCALKKKSLRVYIKKEYYLMHVLEMYISWSCQ